MQLSKCVFYTYNPELREHTYTTQMPNPIDFVREVYNKEQALASVRELMRGICDGMDEMLTNITDPPDSLPVLEDDDELPLGWEV